MSRKLQISEQDEKMLKSIRNYFGLNDKTPFEHAAYHSMDKLIKQEPIKYKPMRFKNMRRFLARGPFVFHLICFCLGFALGIILIDEWNGSNFAITAIVCIVIGVLASVLFSLFDMLRDS